jgi:hypothetical protein
MRRLLPFLLTASLLAPHRAAAQLSELQAGLRVRVTAPPLLGSRYDATIGARRADTLSLVKTGASPIDVPLSAIRHVEVSRGKSRSAGAKRGLLWGAGVSVAVILYRATRPERDATGQCPRQPCKATFRLEDAATVLLGPAAWGSAIGALVGRERWETLDIGPRTGTHDMAFPSGRTRVGLRVSF